MPGKNLLFSNSDREYSHYIMVKKINSGLWYQTWLNHSINSVKENNNYNNKKEQKKNEKAIKQKQQNQVK